MIPSQQISQRTEDSMSNRGVRVSAVAEQRATAPYRVEIEDEHGVLAGFDVVCNSMAAAMAVADALESRFATTNYEALIR